MEKGVHFAIDVAQYLDIPLIIAAKQEPETQLYFDQYIGPRLSDDRIKWIGEVDDKQKMALMANALCFLHPVTWREPFGLTMIEAMACGCPVVGFNKGSIPEIVKNGKTGYVVEDLEQMISAVENIGKINRLDCRKYALENFSAERMAQDYERIYYQILENANKH